MKSLTIMPCICSEGDKEKEDMCQGGMPIFRPSRPNPRFPNKHLWSYECPDCGRGGLGITEEKSIYYAIKEWNKLQESLRRMDIFPE